MQILLPTWSILLFIWNIANNANMEYCETQPQLLIDRCRFCFPLAQYCFKSEILQIWKNMSRKCSKCYLHTLSSVKQTHRQKQKTPYQMYGAINGLMGWIGTGSSDEMRYRAPWMLKTPSQMAAKVYWWDWTGWISVWGEVCYILGYVFPGSWKHIFEELPVRWCSITV